MTEKFELYTTDRGTLEISWSDLENLYNFASVQNGGYGQGKIVDPAGLFKKYFSVWNTRLWNTRKNMSVFDLPNNSKIMDIGCGLAITDLLLYSYIPESKIYLLDKEEPFDFNNYNYFDETYGTKHPFYHSWKPIEDAITTSNFDRSRFTLLEPDDSFPEDLDLVMSFFSWCWHYPKEMYWDRVLKSLKKGGKLYLDVKDLPDKNVMDEISEELKSNPITIRIPKPKNVEMDNGVGYHCLWTKNV